MLGGCSILAEAADTGDVILLLDRQQVVKTIPTPLAKASGFGAMNTGLLLGNGNLMVSVAAGALTQVQNLAMSRTFFDGPDPHGR
jgi:hypothetical protein